MDAIHEHALGIVELSRSRAIWIEESRRNSFQAALAQGILAESVRHFNTQGVCQNGDHAIVVDGMANNKRQFSAEGGVHGHCRTLS